ncbi:MAG: polyprenyl synthetase family protein [Desulfobacterales bacterium]|nr:polyprenyl synthetase family protein [Desulfobacterales bacterium]
MTEFNLSEYLNENRILVEGALDRILGCFDRDLELVRAITHSLMAGGKRVRPVLGLAAARACGKDPLVALPACCAIEMIHTYSLIHDDLPAMDDDDLRRGLPTCHKRFSEATAILAGDGLLTHAFHVLAAADEIFDLAPDAATRLKLVAKISGAAGVSGMVEGQMLDMQAESADYSDLGNKEQRLEHLKKIHRHKTGEMIRVSVEAGALSAGAEPPALTALVRYADHIGLAFQVMDDILNVEGDPEIMGKAAGSDALHDKMTFPAIIGLEPSKAYARDLIDTAVTALDSHDGFGEKAEPLRAIARYIINRNR